MHATTTRSECGKSNPVLMIDLVDEDRLDITADRSISMADPGEIGQRIEQILACGFVNLRVDFAAVASLQSAAGSVFIQAGDRLRHAGGELQVYNTNPIVAAALGLS